MDTKAILKERGSRYGTYNDNSRVMQALKTVMRSGASWDTAPDTVKEALESIAIKLGRIVNGDPTYDDNWRDLAGYAQLVLDSLPQKVDSSVKDVRHLEQDRVKLYKRPFDGKMVPFNELPEDAQVQVMNEELGPKSAPIKATTPEPYQNPPLVPRRPPEGPGTPEDGSHHARQVEELRYPDSGGLESVLTTEYGTFTLKTRGVYETGGGDRVTIVGSDELAQSFTGAIGVGKDTRKVRYNTRGCAGSGAVDDIVKHISTLV